MIKTKLIFNILLTRNWGFIFYLQWEKGTSNPKTFCERLLSVKKSLKTVYQIGLKCQSGHLVANGLSVTCQLQDQTRSRGCWDSGLLPVTISSILFYCQSILCLRVIQRIRDTQWEGVIHMWHSMGGSQQSVTWCCFICFLI